MGLPSLPSGTLLLVYTTGLLLFACNGILNTHATINSDTTIPQSVVFKQGKEGYHTYRIPSLVVTNTSILALAEGRRYSSNDHGCVHIVVKRSTDGGETWSPVTVAASDPDPTANVTYGNPAPVWVESMGKVILVFCVDNKYVMVVESLDDGVNWSAPKNISSSVTRPDWTWVATGPPSSVAIPFASSPTGVRIVTPCDHVSSSDKTSYSHAMYSDDGGSTWALGGTVNLPTSNECQVAPFGGPGGLMMNMRNGGQYRQFSISKDGGVSWGTPIPAPSAISPVCEGSIVSDTELYGPHASCLYISNPFNADKRENMTVSRSCGGNVADWSPIALLYSGQSGYSSLAWLPPSASSSKNSSSFDVRLGCLYENGVHSSFDQLTLAYIPITSADPSPPPISSLSRVHVHRDRRVKMRAKRKGTTSQAYN